MSLDQTGSGENLDPLPDEPAPARPARRTIAWNEVLHDIASGGAVRTLLAIVLALVVGALLVIFTNEDVAETLGYVFSRPSDFFSAAGRALSDAGTALIRGSIYNDRADTFEAGIRPFTESLRFAGPLIAAGLGIALTFRAGLFNIGGQGQILLAAIFSSFVASQLQLPFPLHLIAAALAGLLGAAIWAGIVGYLKARTGAHEVIVTIMMNYIAVSLITYLMRTPILHDMESGSNPTSIPPEPSAVFPLLLGDAYNLRWSFVVCLLAVAVYWWLMERSPLGFRLRMVGLNVDAARAAGVNVNTTAITAMVLSGLFIGLAGINQSIGRDGNFGPNVDSGIGFEAITVALLGNSRAIGVLFAGLLFGLLKAAGPSMQVADVAPEVLGVVQGVIVLFIAAPPLVRAIFRFIPEPRAVTR